MDGQPTQSRKAQLDKEEREHLEDVVTEMRDRVEANVRYQLEDKYDLDEKPDSDASLSEEQEDLVEAIELEAVDGNDWDDGYEEYITGIGYTIVNRLAALRCMEVRDFIDDEVTTFRDDGLTPAADRLVTEEFMLEEEAVLEAYRNAADALAEEIDILFDRSTAYSLIDPDDDTFEDLCELLDKVSDKVWRADDVLGWVYEYYNRPNLDEVRKRAHSGGGLRTEDVGIANQFYTPHWVVRMLTDNSLGKLYLEDNRTLQDTVKLQESFSAEERKNRDTSLNASPNVSDFCTYLVPSEERGKPSAFDHPEDIQVIDPACGSGHFLLYAFDVLERIWRAETDLNNAEIPRKILRHNLYGIDLDMRACQLSAFSLYLKARTRAENEGGDGFSMPELGIVCADAKVADVEGVEEVFDEVANGKDDVEGALARILDAFEEINGLGSLLDVRGTLGELFEDEIDAEGVQITLSDDPREDHTLSDVLHSLREAVDEHTNAESLLAQDLRSFIRLLHILAQDYDVALMNPPYGSGKRMPDSIQQYIEEHYNYYREFYINFFEVCDSLVKDNGRIGMLVPWTLIFKPSFQTFREDFIGGRGTFDFLAEYGYGVLDNATVGTVGTVVRKSAASNQTGDFIRLHDISKGEKEKEFAKVISGRSADIQRYYSIELSEFAKVPGTPMMYSLPEEIRNLHDTSLKIDPERADIEGEGIADAVQGLATSNNDRFVRNHWECITEEFRPYAKGGSDAWVLPNTTTSISWKNDGDEIKRLSSSRFQNEDFYMRDGLTWTYIKRTGRRFGYIPETIFDVTGSMLFPKEEYSPWLLLSALNSTVYHGLFLSITPERDWQMGVVGRIPWHESLLEAQELEEIAKEQYNAFAAKSSYNPRHPLYIACGLVPDDNDFFYSDSVHIARRDNVNINRISIRNEWSVTRAAREVERHKREIQQQIEELAQRTDQVVIDTLEIPEDVNKLVKKEIFLRTSEDPEDRVVPSPESIPRVPENLDAQVKDLIHHFAMEAIREQKGSIIPLEGTDEQADMLDRIVEQFYKTYDEYAEDRLVEVDDILGAESAADEAYPNLRAFVEDDLFAYHVDTMENTPIVWKISTEQLLADAKGEGFACFVDYHQLDASLFDRLSNQYLEPRKTELRERRSAANQRRNDESLSTSERAEATDQFKFCSSALEQIAELEEVMQELGSTSEREFDDDDRERLTELAPKVAAFREETAERVKTLERLREINGEEWFQETFSNNFWNTVDERCDEWLDALEELEHACEEYAKPSDEPVEAHLADLFDYFNWKLKGSDHYSSTGILFMTYYFEREGSDLLDDDGKPFENLTEDEQTLASLAMGIDDASVLDEEYLQQIADEEGVDDVDELPPLAEFKTLAEEIDDRCQSVYKQIPSDWKNRALSEVTTAGYQPNHKHGVAINITPLAEKDIVPEVVEDKVL